MLETYYRILKHDPEGKLVKDSGLIESHSYVIQFLEFIEGLFDTHDATGTDVDNAETLIVDSSGGRSTQLRNDAPAGDDTYGVLVGTNAGPTAEDNEDYKLDTKIEHSGVGEANKLNYQAVTFVAPRVVAPNVDFDISRAFLNETGGTITVKEIGLVVKNSTGVAAYHLLLRDVVADEAVDDAETLTVVYVLRTTA